MTAPVGHADESHADGASRADPRSPRARDSRLYTFCRWFGAFVVGVYAFAKLNGSQFTILDSELAKPMGDVSGFWLTWYYFGYSAVYGGAIALAQLAGAVLLTFRRTALLGACVLLAMLANIVLVDLFYGVEPSALLAAVVLLLCMAVIVGAHGDELYALFWARRGDAAPRSPARLARAVAGRAAMFGVPAALTYWLANYNNRDPTPLDGAWRVASAAGAPADSLPSAIYFERNRAYMAVFRYAGHDGAPDRWAPHHFAVDPSRRTIGVWARWLARGDTIFTGAYTLSGDSLRLDGRLFPARSLVRLTLVRDRRVRRASF